MNIIQSIIKKKQKKLIKKKKKKLLRIVNKKGAIYNRDMSYYKTINILRRPITIFIYLNNLDLKLGSINLATSVSQKQLSKYINTFLKNTSVLLSPVQNYTLYGTKHHYSNKETKINPLSDINILNIILKYNEHKKYNYIYSEQRLPFLLNIIVKPKKKREMIYVNYKNTIYLTKLDECIVCMDTKYLKKICDNNHFSCFKCEKLLQNYNTKLCPMCRKPL